MYEFLTKNSLYVVLLIVLICWFGILSYAYFSIGEKVAEVERGLTRRRTLGLTLFVFLSIPSFVIAVLFSAFGFSKPETSIYGLVSLLYGLFVLAMCVGVWRVAPWGRLMAIGLLVGSLLVATAILTVLIVSRSISAVPDVLPLLLAVLVTLYWLLYFNKPKIQELFRK